MALFTLITIMTLTFKKHFLLLCFTIFFIQSPSFAQQTDSTEVVLPASESYYKNKFYKFLWGEHYRKEWHTPVRMPIVYLDTLNGGLTVYKLGGGRQTKSLRVRDKNEREYVLRSLDKSFGKALPSIAEGTFVEAMANDQVTLAHPYAVLIVAPLAKAADIFHATPKLYYVPKQKALGIYNDSMGNLAYTFEQRPDENWSIEENFGNSKNIVSTAKMMENTLEDNDDVIDQYDFVKARLFDMFIGDWGRHEDQWRWATFKNGKKTLYKPIPRDRDNAFSVFDGFLLRRAIKTANADHLQSFDYKIKDIEKFNFPARHLDRRFTTELNLSEWENIARVLQGHLTDAVIDDAVKQMPPEVYPISGKLITDKLKKRRDDLVKYAREYFLFLNYEVSLPLSEKNDYVDINRLSDTSTEVTIYKITNKGNVKSNPVYHRIFDNRQTKEIRIFGIDGDDKWHIKGDVNKSIKFRLIGGPQKDIYIDSSRIKRNGRRTIIYDNYDNQFVKGSETNLHLSKDSSIHTYEYDWFEPSISKIYPIAFFSNEDRLFVGLKYVHQKSQWRKHPYGLRQDVDIKYSIQQDAFSYMYKNRFNQLLGKWSLNTFANYDDIRWSNFFGIGNESIRPFNDRTFYRYRSREFSGKLGFDRVFNNKQKIFFNGLFQTFKIIEDTDRFLSKVPALNVPNTFETKRFAGGEFGYVYQNINDSTLPTKGFAFLANTDYVINIDNSSRYVWKYGLEANIYIPLSKRFSVAIKPGANSLSGTPEFYQYNIIGNAQTVRGYERNRFYGNSSVYDQNELRYIFPVKSWIFNGRAGIFAHYDVGRVWLDGEDSNTWHSGYGAGVIISPFNFATFQVSYSASKNENRIGFGVLRIF